MNDDLSVTGAAKSAQLQGLRLCLEKADEWLFDVFELEKESDGLPLQVGPLNCQVQSQETQIGLSSSLPGSVMARLRKAQPD